MAEVERYRREDRRAVDALYRRVFGTDAAEASRLRWEWQYRRNPNNPGQEPEIWIAREGPAIVGQYATMPVRLRVQGSEVQGSWGMDVMVAPERQRQGLGEVLFRTWDRNVGASLGLGLSEASYRLFQKLRWPDVGPVPCFVKPLTRRALRRPEWPVAVNRIVSALTLPIVKIVARNRPLRAEVRMLQRFDDSFTRAVGCDRVQVQPRRQARRRLPQLEVRRRPARPLLDCRAPARRPQRRLRRVPPSARTARARHAARGLPDRSGRRGRLQHAARLDRPGSPPRRFRQDPHLRAAPAASAACSSAPATSR